MDMDSANQLVAVLKIAEFVLIVRRLAFIVARKFVIIVMVVEQVGSPLLKIVK